ncbi:MULTISPECIES: SDR family oxidoreductase [unclassified Mycolicibacterium]|uniref:SDR family NAD(P)-dependent oxidoreductase n=1 Tax=unclassified Mycolicibacterium TaxID=2636767 RepID=UPI0013064AD8|nr:MULTISPECIES: SDR family oxidoreductase [unclassified Mycolicibacterium]MUL82115.1 SDR family oxidoreductase [Mycolicibacterium sp. CBMA 329]MUL87881.1 SDR family oxidoreductase [Mycolicibacterium sp. CBMA 331]MUM01704.1 SDR family oxidoreductase [Mycolicibacterium sp. CBMA 334]MUM28438.1 SDR family oxidoreductase [Mycolicibacterium sp. CBMA 295]MUM38178.1 SDR family oxidoreductase [Mycolicibacterium sp. CBMA 247]
MNNSPSSALVTGASRGIGLVIAKRLAAQGMALTITARDQGALDALVPTLTDLGAPSVLAVSADMADPAGPAALVEAHRSLHGDMAALIVNAGVGTAGPIASYPAGRLDKTLAVNFRSPFLLIQAALPLLRAGASRRDHRGAKIVVLSSITGVYAEAGLAAYGASKAAVISLVETLNAEESGNGVSATAIAPAYVNTDMSAWVHDKVRPEQMIPAEDIAILVDALLQLSARSTFGPIAMARAGTGGYCG